MKILVTGATGLLGGALRTFLTDMGHQFIGQGRRVGADERVELSDPEAVAALVERVQPDAVVHAAALSNVDQCQRDPHQAYLANVVATQNLARVLEGSGLPWCFLSTDQVYAHPGPSREDQVVASGVYALTKLWAEAEARRGQGVVLRTNFFGPSSVPHRQSQSDWFLDQFQAQRPATLFADIQFSPLRMRTVAAEVLRVLEAPIPGTYNLFSRDGFDKARFALLLAETLGVDPGPARVGSSSEIPQFRDRPKDTRGDPSLYQETYGVELPTLEEEVLSLGSPTA